tara:strand:- start:7 stop:180 length:174 start_codon:yes stop_codon:yes gene_type:complete
MSVGTIKRMSRLANKIPMARLIAIGIMNCAVVLVSKISGINPKEVVAVVINIGRNLL